MALTWLLWYLESEPVDQSFLSVFVSFYLSNQSINRFLEKQKVIKDFKELAIKAPFSGVSSG